MRVILFKLIGVLVLVGSFTLGWFYMDYQGFKAEPLGEVPEGHEITIEPGMGLNTVSKRLEGEGVIRSARYFRWMARLEGRGSGIKAGTYRITAGTTPPVLLRQMMEGRVAQFSLTLVEGWNIHQVIEAVQHSADLKQTLRGLTDAQVMARLGRPGEHPEGRFFPETYNFPRGLTDLAFLQRARRLMEERLAYEWEHREPNLPYQSAYQALIMASIVEKETGLASERRQIAGVFIRRLKKGMRLQTDPTVIYGLGIGFDGNLRRRDLLAENPYNTYRNKGLPPTPIAMPGGDAIHAALHPAPGNTLYFVAKGDGSHHFSATLEEHNRAVVKYQLRGKARPFSSSPK